VGKHQRWGDAPVHTIGAALLQSADRIHFFRDIGYQHYQYMHCPTGDFWKSARCACDPANNIGMLSLSDRS
jgi:alpha 1,2-mannosyltransferase